MVHKQKEKEFIELKMSANLRVMQYASKFTELFKFIPEFVPSKRLKMRRFNEGLAFYICDQLVGQSIHTYQELYERAVELGLSFKIECHSMHCLIRVPLIHIYVYVYIYIYTRSAMQLNLEYIKAETNYRIKLSNESMIECPTS